MDRRKLVTLIVVLFTIGLAGVAVFTAVRLYQQRQESVAPTAPTSIPRAQEASPSPAPQTTSCEVTSFNLATGFPSPTPSGTPAPTPTPTPAPQCNDACTTNSDCPSTMVCNSTSGTCRNPSCTSEADCACAISQATPTPQPELPEAGIGSPTILGFVIGLFAIVGAVALAF